jgi:hypothetical protein
VSHESFSIADDVGRPPALPERAAHTAESRRACAPAPVAQQPEQPFGAACEARQSAPRRWRTPGYTGSALVGSSVVRIW